MTEHEVTSGGGGFDLAAVFSGIISGFFVALILAVLLGAVAYQWPLSPLGALRATLAVQALGMLVAGFRAAAKSRGDGWLHGLAAGLGLAGALVIVSAIGWGLPGWTGLLPVFGLGASLGLLGGVFGVNFSR